MNLLKFNRITIVTLIIFGVQFINALEYMMVTPIFPLMAEGLGQTVNQAGYVASSYTLASVLTGLVGFFWLDRFNKKRILLLSLVIIGLLTGMIPWITHFGMLLSLRFITGIFGGLVLGAAMAVLLDVIPEDQRAKMIAYVLLAFPLVSIIGLPFMLWVAERWHWHSAFYLLATICLFCTIAVIFGVKSNQISQDIELPSRPKIKMNLWLLMGAALPGISNLGTFMLIPLLVPIYEVLLKLPAIEIPWLFFVGGIGALLGTKLAGKFSDQASKQPLSRISLLVIGTILLLLSMIMLIWGLPVRWFAYLFSFLLMLATYLRFTTITIICADIPKVTERGGFNALQAAFNHLFASLAFILPALWLQDGPFTKSLFSPIVYMGIVVILLFLLCFAGLKKVLKEAIEEDGMESRS